MKRSRGLLLLVGFLASGVATADGEVPSTDRVSGHKPPPLEGIETIEDIPRFYRSMDGGEEMVGKYPARIVRGAEILQNDVDFVYQCWLGMEGLYRRDYKTTQTIFEQVNERWPSSGIAPVGRALTWQALMLENFDFRYDSQYTLAFKKSRQSLTAALQVPGNDVWETFLLGAMLGVDAIHTMRKEEYLTAVNRGLEAMRYVAQAAEMAPDFVDARLGDGLWLYWRSVLSMNMKGIPGFDDERAKGIEMMRKAQRESVFLRPAAGHALTYTWIEEGRMNQALGLARALTDSYPNNIINRLVLGRIQMYKRMYPESEATYQGILAADDDNRRVHYYLQRLYLRWNKLDKSIEHADTYLAFEHLTDTQRAYAHYHKGNAYMKRNDLDNAETEFKLAWKTDRLKRAKERLERVEQKRAAAQN
ncbi:MAG: hypothetical protein AAFV53_04085 [Myxococcota bacterium]